MREILNDIVEDNKRAGDVIRRLRSLLKKGRREVKALDLNEAVGEVARLVGGDALVWGLAIQLELDPGLPLVLGDRAQLQQVALNLVLNAMDAMQNARTDRRSSSPAYGPGRREDRSGGGERFGGRGQRG